MSSRVLLSPLFRSLYIAGEKKKRKEVEYHPDVPLKLVPPWLPCAIQLTGEKKEEKKGGGGREPLTLSKVNVFSLLTLSLALKRKKGKEGKEK